MRTFLAVVWTGLLLLTTPTHAAEPEPSTGRVSGWWNSLTSGVAQTWEDPQYHESLSAVYQLARPFYVRRDGSLQ